MTISGEVNDRQGISGDLQMPRIVSGGSITVDSELSSTSENPVQNKAIKAALDGKGATTAIPASGSVSANGLISFKNADNTQLFTVQLPLYAGGVS